MPMCRSRVTEGPRKRGAVVVNVAILLVVLLGFAALTVDVGVMYNTRADLQRAADAAALAAASRLTEFGGEDPAEKARQTALEYVNSNPVFGKTLTLDLESDVTLGRAVYDEETGEYDFTPTDVLPEAVRVRVRHTGSSPNGSVPLFFARIFGKEDTNMWASALAIVIPRDIAVVADLSGSHTDDSEMSNKDNIEVNMWEVWQSFPGGVANVDEYGNVGTSWGGESYARAQAAANLGFRIFAVSVGSGANLDFMDEIAQMASGEHFHAEGSIEEYSEQLTAIFQQLGGRRPVELIR